MPVGAVTALRGLDDKLGVKEGDRLLVFGASGDVGHLAVQLAQRMGAAVLGVASGEDGIRLVECVAFPHGVEPEPERHGDVEPIVYDADPDPDIHAKLNRLIEAEPFEVHVARTFALEEAAEAHRAIDEHHIGKLTLRIGG